MKSKKDLLLSSLFLVVRKAFPSLIQYDLCKTTSVFCTYKIVLLLFICFLFFFLFPLWICLIFWQSQIFPPQTFHRSVVVFIPKTSIQIIYSMPIFKNNFSFNSFLAGIWSYLHFLKSVFYWNHLFLLSSYGRRTFGFFTEHQFKGPKPMVYLGNLKQMHQAVSIRNKEKKMDTSFKFLKNWMYLLCIFRSFLPFSCRVDDCMLKTSKSCYIYS